MYQDYKKTKLFVGWFWVQLQKKNILNDDVLTAIHYLPPAVTLCEQSCTSQKEISHLHFENSIFNTTSL